jgi:hypothetical protein
MKKLLTIGLCGLIACSDITAGSGLIISLNVSPTFIQPGQSMQIRVLVRNASAEAKQLIIDECKPYFEIINSSGQVVGPAPRACALDLQAPQTITTGTEVRIDETWAGESSSTTAGGPPVYLAPGVYKLRPRALLGSGEWVYGQEISVTVTAAP